MDNLGVKLGKRPEDYRAGLVGASLPYEERNPSGNWSSWIPVGEWQRQRTINDVRDTMACVSFSALNSIETQIEFLTGLQVNFSDRFTAKMSGTTTSGNYLYKVADSIRKDGLLVEEDWAWPENFSWDEYYKEIPQELKDKAKNILEAIDIKYEWIPLNKAEILKHLKQSPLQTVILDGKHAVMTFKTLEDINWYFDSYKPFIKSTDQLAWPLKYVVTIKDEQKLREFVQKDMLKLIKRKDLPQVYAVFPDGSLYHIDSYPMLEKGHDILWDKNTIEEVDSIDWDKVEGDFHRKP